MKAPLGQVIHEQATRFFPSLKTIAIRKVNRNVRLSNALRRLANRPTIDEPFIEEIDGFIPAGKRDASRAVKAVVGKGARKAANHPDVRQHVLPLLDSFPRLRAWLKGAFYASPTTASSNTSGVGNDALTSLSPRGLMIYGLLTAIEQRGAD
ncbi:MAG: hypothetical protein LBM75_02750 [Myxococcales bacterium]|jgi:hypothetical protein|nr:hypothetical protein [Myxococcales bacterium]